MLDLPFVLHGFRWRPSSFDEGGPVFFVVDATALTDSPGLVRGQRIVLTTGSANVLAQLTNMAKRGTLPGAVRAVKRADAPTRQGFYPLWLYTPDGYELDAEAVEVEVDESNPLDSVH